MLRDILYKGKELADKVTNIMMNYTEVELKVREATNDEICCPHGRLLQKLADYTYTHDTFLEVMSVLWKRMHSDGNCSWRRVYKSLFVLAFLLRNGSDYVAQAARDHIYDIRTLESFRYFDENGKDQGMNVRIKVQEVIDLLQDPEKLQEERQKAKASRHLYTGYGNANESDWGYSSYGSRGGGGGGGGGGTDYYRRSDSFDNYDKDDYISKSYTFQSHTTPKPPTMPRMESDLPPPRLGSFDDWHVGKERGVIDDVLEQFKEAWDMAKESTKDLIFTKKSPDIRTNESNPRMVSEEVYEFPPDAVETGGTYELRTHSAGYGTDHPPVQNKFSSSINSSNLSSINQRNSNVSNNNNNSNSIHGKPHSNGRSVDHMQKVIVEPRQPESSRNNPKPRPPSCDLMDSFGNLTIGSNQVIDLFDTCDTIHSPTGSTNSQRQQQQQQQSQHMQNTFVENWPESLTPSNVSSNTNTNQNYSPISYQNHDNLLDNEFGDFASATVQSSSIPVNASTAVTNSSLLSFDDIDFPSSNTNYQTTGGQNQSFWNKPAEENRQQQQQQQQQPLQSNPTSPSKGKSINIGSTWKDLETLSIDLDSLVKPEKYGTRAQAPSLHQLKQSQQRVQS